MARFVIDIKVYVDKDNLNEVLEAIEDVISEKYPTSHVHAKCIDFSLKNQFNSIEAIKTGMSNNLTQRQIKNHKYVCNRSS